LFAVETQKTGKVSEIVDLFWLCNFHHQFEQFLGKTIERQFQTKIRSTPDLVPVNQASAFVPGKYFKPNY
jgi:hypothetical protein